MPYFTSEILSGLWGLGRANFSSFSARTAGYVAHYSMGKFDAGQMEIYDPVPDPETGELLLREEPFLISLAVRHSVGASLKSIGNRFTPMTFSCCRMAINRAMSITTMSGYGSITRRGLRKSKPLGWPVLWRVATLKTKCVCWLARSSSNRGCLNSSGTPYDPAVSSLRR